METPQLNDHKQNCGQARAESKFACIMQMLEQFRRRLARIPAYA